MRGALKEAELYLKQAIAALSTTPETPARISREFDLQYALWQVLTSTCGFGAGENMRASRRMRELAEKTGKPEQLILALRAAWDSTYHGQREMTAAQEIAEQLMEFARRSGSRYGLTLAHMFQGTSFYFRGELTQAMQDFEAGIASYNETDWSGPFVNPHVGMLGRISEVLWHFGTADQARAKIRESISLSESLKNPSGMSGALFLAGVLYIQLREPGNVQEVAERLLTLASEQHPAFVDDASVV